MKSQTVCKIYTVLTVYAIRESPATGNEVRWTYDTAIAVSEYHNVTLFSLLR